ncbi:FeoA family protein [Liquorilactobacillus sicerae]|uniref:FeoA family protein n=1 Tax=Liquorilactobacillus sicerae TaxID=1416943 RepID=UPI00247FB3FD|nr:ferrous iron transport protein A [Liquorilactobacillus sicerae]
MESLAAIKEKGKYIVVDIIGASHFVRRLAEMGLVVNSNLTVISVSQNESGLVVFLKGQRLAISDSLASSILVKGIDELGDLQVEPLAQLETGKSAVVSKIIGERPVRRRLMDMGLTKNTVIKILRVAPLGDPIELVLRGYKLSIRKQEAEYIMVREVLE